MLERDLCGWEGMEGWVSSRDAEMEFGVQICTRVHSCKRKDQKSRETCCSLITAAGNSEGSMACQKLPSGARCGLWTSSPSVVGSAPPGKVEPLRWTSLAKSAARAPVEGSSADCPVAGDKPILEEGIAVQCKEHGIKSSGRSGIHRIHSVFPIGRADSVCQW